MGFDSQQGKGQFCGGCLACEIATEGVHNIQMNISLQRLTRLENEEFAEVGHIILLSFCSALCVGEVVAKPAWGKDQPNNYNGEQNCVVLDGGRSWLWNDVGCNLDYLHWICQHCECFVFFSYVVSFVSCHCARQLYRIEDLHPPGHLEIVAVFRNASKRNTKINTEKLSRIDGTWVAPVLRIREIPVSRVSSETGHNIFKIFVGF